MEVVELMSAVIVTLVIKICWTLQQTMERLHDRHSLNNDRSLYQSALHVPAVAATPNVSNTEQSNVLSEYRKSFDESSGDRLLLITSTPLAHTSDTEMMLSRNYSSICYSEERGRDRTLNRMKEAFPDHKHRNHQAENQLDDLPKPSHVPSEIRCPLPSSGSTLSPDTAKKYLQLVQASVRHQQRKMLYKRKNIRL